MSPNFSRQARRQWPCSLALVFVSTFTQAAFAEDADQHADGDEVVVTVTALRKSSLQVAQPAAVLSGDDLVRDRATSIGEALAGTAGVSATWFGPQASRPVIRGQTGERVQVTEDGAESLDVAALSADHAVTIDPLLAERVEVLRGPATLLFGNGAAGGLVNVLVRRVPEQAFDGLTGAFEARGTSALGEGAAALRLDGGVDGWAFHADGYARDTHDVKVAHDALPGGRIANSATSLRGGAVGASRVGDAGFAGVAVSRFETDYGIPGPEDGVAIDLAQTRVDFNSHWHPHGSRFDGIRLRASYNRYEHAELEPGGEVGTQFDQRGLALRLSGEHASIAGWRGSFGVQWRDVDFSALGEEAFVPASVTRNLGFFLYEERALGAVTVELGARLESQRIDAELEGVSDYDSARMSYAAGLVWQFAANWNTALNLTSTQRHATATELYADGPHLAVQRFEIGDATLRPERQRTADLSLRRHTEQWGLTLTAYVSDYDDYIYTTLTGDIEDDLPVANYQQRDARFTGFEAELDLPELEFGGGKLATHLVADAVRAELSSGEDLPQIPPLRVGAELRYTLGEWSAGFSAQHHLRQDRVAAYETTTAGYTLVGLDASWRTEVASHPLHLFVRADNLLDADARRHTSPLKEYAPLPGRSLGAGVRVEF
jgi:iron complex outermembrane receptor protein